MSSSQNQVPQPPKSASSNNQPEEPTQSVSESVPLSETAMDQQSASTLVMDPYAASTPLEVMSSTVPDQPESIATSDNQDSNSIALMRQHPIPPASEPMQYRAIGLVKAKYQPSDEQFTRGTLLTEEGTPVNAVLLGRIMSLVKKHLDLEQSHLWVVYPRTRDKETDLHVQIVGVWEPEKLNKLPDSASQEEAESSDASAQTEAKEPSESATVDLQDGYFSIRGEILYHSPEEERLIVKIQQSPRRNTEEGKAFKLLLKGDLAGKTVGYFWDLQVQREEKELVVKSGQMIGLVPPRKRTGKPDGRKPGPGGFKKRWTGTRPQRTGGSRPTPPPPPTRREPAAKPIKRPKNDAPSE